VGDSALCGPISWRWKRFTQETPAASDPSRGGVQDPVELSPQGLRHSLRNKTRSPGCHDRWRPEAARMTPGRTATRTRYVRSLSVDCSKIGSGRPGSGRIGAFPGRIRIKWSYQEVCRNQILPFASKHENDQSR